MQPLVTLLISIVLTLTINIVVVVKIRQQQKEDARKERRKRNFRGAYLLLLLINITVAVTITVTVRVENSNNQVPSPTPSPLKPDGDPEAAKLREKLRTPYEGDGFTLKPLREGQLVRGLNGSYYELIVKGPALFPVGEYIIRGQDEAYSKPLDNFFDEIITILRRAHVQHRLFIKGSADRAGDQRFRRDFKIARYTYREIPYLPYDIQQEQFAQDTAIRHIPGQYTNRDLPDLRARYTQESLSSDTRQLESTILAGVVTPKLNEPLDRNITVLLYVRWQ